MIFYHLSENLKHDGLFIPRIPENRFESENNSIKRISVGLSIEDCLTALPGGGGRLNETIIENRGYYKVFKIDTEKLGILDDFIVYPNELYEKDYVRDAEITNEHWITKTFKIFEEDSFIMILTNSWDDIPKDIFPYSLFKIAENKYDGDIFEAYENEYNHIIPSIGKIENIEYFTENIKKDEEVSLYYACEDKEKEKLIDFIENKYKQNILIKDSDIDTLTIVSKTNINIKDLLMYHSSIKINE